MTMIWVLFGSPTLRIPLGVFTTLDKARQWVEENEGTYRVLDYELDASSLDSLRLGGDAARDPVPFTDSLVAARSTGTGIPLPNESDPHQTSPSTPLDRRFVWLWISLRPDRRPIPSAAFSSLERAESFVEGAKGSGAIFRYFMSTVPGVGGRTDYEEGRRTTPSARERLLQNTSGRLRDVVETVTDQDLAEAEEAATRVETIVPAHRSWITAYKRWQELVESIESGYPGDSLMYDYWNQLSSRGVIDLILKQMADGASRSRLETSLEPLDDRFMANTGEWHEQLDSVSRGPWSNRVPKVVSGRFAAELAKRRSEIEDRPS
jgi:hypothetical protein